MSVAGSRNIYEELGVKRIINASGNMTLLGGSILSSKVRAAMEEANEYFVDMEELLDKSGRAIAELLGAEAAYVTSGCAAALVLGAAAIMADKDPDKIARLPDTTGMKNEFLIQKRMRYHYDRCVTVPGARLVEVGDEDGTTSDQLEEAIGDNTAGILYLARLEGSEGILPIPEVVAIAQRKGVAVLLDAAAEVYPLERMTGLPKSGADLVCFGAKYFGSTHSSGILCGRRDLVEAAALQGFIGYEAQESRSLGRAMKVDRQEIIATVIALREWLTMDHETRLLQNDERGHTIIRRLSGLPNVKAEPVLDRRGPSVRMRVVLDEAGLNKSAEEVAQALKEGDPSIWVRPMGNAIYISLSTLREGEAEIVAERLRDVLS